MSAEGLKLFPCLFRIIGNVGQKLDLQILKNNQLTAILSSKKIFLKFSELLLGKQNVRQLGKITKFVQFLDTIASQEMEYI